MIKFMANGYKYLFQSMVIYYEELQKYTQVDMVNRKLLKLFENVNHDIKYFTDDDKITINWFIKEVRLLVIQNIMEEQQDDENINDGNLDDGVLGDNKNNDLIVIEDKNTFL